MWRISLYQTVVLVTALETATVRKGSVCVTSLKGLYKSMAGAFLNPRQVLWGTRKNIGNPPHLPDLNIASVRCLVVVKECVLDRRITRSAKRECFPIPMIGTIKDVAQGPT